MSSILEVLFSSTARIEVLSLFLLNPDRHFYQREIGRETGQPIRAVQREMDRLAGIGLLVRAEEGNRVFYYLDSQFPLLAELTALFQKAEGVASGRHEHAAQAIEAGSQAVKTEPQHCPEPSSIKQPFAWMETPPAAPLPPELRRIQSSGEWDQAY
jgi:predicted DNA-binding transcriptional regulator YafY